MADRRLSRSSGTLATTIIILAVIGAVAYLAHTKVLTSDATLGIFSGIVAAVAGVGGARAGANGSRAVGDQLAAHLDEHHQESR